MNFQMFACKISGYLLNKMKTWVFPVSALQFANKNENLKKHVNIKLFQRLTHWMKLTGKKFNYENHIFLKLVTHL